jgi:hypothetical protein
MISRRSSGSMRAESAVDPTRSEDITVIWRRSAVSWGLARVNVDGGMPGLNWQALQWSLTSFVDARAGRLSSQGPDRSNIRAPRNQFRSKPLRVLPETELLQPISDLLHRRPGSGDFSNELVSARVASGQILRRRDLVAKHSSACSRQQHKRLLL